jgi:hypothetical protein
MNFRRGLLIAFCCCLLAAFAAAQSKGTPADGYTIHVTAPHYVNGKVMGPYHHYCKVVAPDPQIVCLIYDSTDPNAMLTQVEYIMAKSLTRPSVSRVDWNKLWHDHAVEIAGGRVKVLDVPPEKAKEIADVISKTDGIIYSFDFTGKLPNGNVTHAQAVGHKPLTAAEYDKSKSEAGGKK